MKEKKTGLVLEGGGMRGIYTAGVLDVFMENGITFDGVIGVSAGAIHYEPFGVYAGKTTSLDELQDGATIAEGQKHPVLYEVLPQLALYELSEPVFNRQHCRGKILLSYIA